jgi:hypothetical protein
MMADGRKLQNNLAVSEILLIFALEIIYQL